MTQPSEHDIDLKDRPDRQRRAPIDRWKAKDRGTYNEWAYAPLEEVKQNLSGTGYPLELCHFVEGDVEQTIPSHVPDRISVLRLDTDWYRSTIHELTHLFPLLSPGGVLIVDDYGEWAGSQKATDEYVQKLRGEGKRLFLMRVDDAGRIAVKQ